MIKKEILKRKTIPVMFLLWQVFLLPLELHGQASTAVFQAHHDNVFIAPGVTTQLQPLWNDELGECGENDILIELLTTAGPHHGTAQLNPTSKIIRYIPASTAGIPFIGRDSLTYRITCNGQSSEAKIYINIHEMPDNMVTDACAITPPATDFSIQQVAYSDEFVQPYAQPFVGDIDGDGELEILTLNYANNNAVSNRILIFDPDLKIKRRIDTPNIHSYGACPLLIADVNGDGYGEIIIASAAVDGYMLYCYRYNGQLLWKSTYPYFNTTPPAANYGNSVALVIGDMNNDGHAEIVAGDRIFDAATGNLLADLPAGQPRGGMISNNCYIYMPALADVDNDGQLEIACGSVVYKATITDRSSSAYINGKNSVSMLANVSSAIGTARKDGYTSIADIDGDGFPDVVVVNGSQMNANNNNGYNSTVLMYAWSPKKNQLLSSVSPSGVSRIGSRAFIGDLIGDENPAVCFTYSTGQATDPRGGMAGYQYNRTTGQFVKLFQKDTSDGSGGTTMSMFDFNLDGEVELVYRDETHLRILDKTGTDLYRFTCYSGTHTEYPVIVDIDQDGHADIIVSGGLVASNSAIRLMRFSHPDNTWAGCRYINNQHGYNPVYINQDLTIPRYPLNPATEFITKDGSRRHQPFNHFLQQVTRLNDEGETLYDGPDIYFDKNYRTELLWNDAADNLTITIAVNNMGTATYANNLRISTYLLDADQSPLAEYLIHNITFAPSVATIPQGTVKKFTYSIPNISTVLSSIPHYTAWEIKLNFHEASNSYPLHQEECRYYNNVNSNISLAYGEHVMCESDPSDISTCEMVRLYPQGVYQYYWYKTPTPASTAEVFHKGDELLVCKDNSPRERYYIQIWNMDETEMLTSKLDTVDIYLFPDTLVWTGLAQDQDWHNFENWYNPRTQVYPRSNVPRYCTNVLIPDIVDNYPDLSPTKTNYTYYAESECDNITFEHGGQVAHPDSLRYTAAYVQLNLLSNRWYMLSAPLRDFYPGDYYVHDPNPCDDDIFVYTRLFGMTNPHTGHYVAADWTGTFPNPNVSLPAGMGYSLWIDDKQPNANVHDSIAFSFPKHDSMYVLYSRDCVPGSFAPIPRQQEHRFVFEQVRNSATGEITLTATASAAKELAIVGNPFMSVLDFDAFYARNSSRIRNYYQVLDATDGNFISYQIGGISTGNLTSGIAPMQSILVESTTAFTELYATPAMTTTTPDITVRSKGTYPPADVLTFSLSKGEQSNKAILALHEQGMDEDNDLSIAKIFMEEVTEPVSVFLTDENGDYKDILHMENPDAFPVYVGVRTSQTGTMRLEVEGINRFASGYELYLTDLAAEKPEQRNLRIYPYYEFEKNTDELFIADRFLLSFVPFVTNTPILREPLLSTGIEVYCRDGKVHVVSVDSSPLEEMMLYDIQGNLCHAMHLPETYKTEIDPGREGIYVVRAKTRLSQRSVKIYVRSKK